MTVAWVCLRTTNFVCNWSSGLADRYLESMFSFIFNDVKYTTRYTRNALLVDSLQLCEHWWKRLFFPNFLPVASYYIFIRSAIAI